MSWLSSETLNNIRVDSGRFGSAMLSEQYLKGESLTDMAWIKSSLLTLVGFAIYQVVVRQLIRTDGVAHRNIRMVLDDILKVGTMLVASRLLSGQQLNDTNWMRESAFMLAGFAAYDLVTVHAVDTSRFDNKVKLALDDVIKFSTMFTVKQWLSGGEFDLKWAKASGFYMVGLVAYDLLLA